MSMIEVKDISVRFDIIHKKLGTLKESFIDLAKRKKDVREAIWALKNVSFDVKPGECLGIVGENASGKTTLLKVIGGILKPTRGGVTVRGVMAPLLTLGVGFNHELTGRENVYLYASIMGLANDEIDRRYEKIVNFSGLSHFMNTKLKNFSDGMKMRLGFATAINVDADILLVDEVLAVGDEGFQKKCLKKFEELKKQGKVIIFVSHGLDIVKKYANKAIFLKNGEAEAIGEPSEVVEKYSKYLRNKELCVDNNRIIENLKEVGIEKINLFDGRGMSWVFETGGKFRVEIDFDSPPESPPSIELLGNSRIRLYSTNFKDNKIFFDLPSSPLCPGEYRLVINTINGMCGPFEIFVTDGKQSNSVKLFSPDFSLDYFFAFGNGCEKVIENLRRGDTVVIFSDFDEAIRNCETGAVFKDGKLLLTDEVEKITEAYKDMIVRKIRVSGIKKG